MCSISRTCIAKEEVTFYLMEGTCNCTPLRQVQHVICNNSSSPRIPKLPLSFTDSNWKCVCILNFSSTFLLSHLSHSLSAHHPPPFTHHFSCPICPTLFQLTTHHHSLAISPVPSVPLSFSSPTTTIHSPVQTMQPLTVQFCPSPRYSLCLQNKYLPQPLF